jgi:hypothetical protein
LVKGRKKREEENKAKDFEINKKRIQAVCLLFKKKIIEEKNKK